MIIHLFTVWIKLLPRDACGIESAARTNPNITIDVYFHTGSKLPVQVKLKTTLRKKIRSCAITDQLKSQYPHNVRFHREDLFLLLKDSRFRPMMDDPQWNTSAFSLIHFTDALKFVLLKKYGGMYLDTNFLTLRPLHCLNNSMTFVAPSVVGEGQQQLCNGVMALDKDHPFLGFAIRFMMTKYRPDRRGVLGGVSLGEAFHMFCGGKNITAGRHSCYKESQIELRVPKLFFPIQRKFIPILFSSNYRNRLDLNTDVLSDSFMTHIYGSQWGLPVNPKSLYATLAMNYCPTTWHVAQSSPETAGFWFVCCNDCWIWKYTLSRREEQSVLI